MLSFQYMSYREHSSLSTDDKLRKILRVARQNKILLMQGRLKPYEEARLIEETMSQITKNFSGISFCTINPNSNGNGKQNKKPISSKIKDSFYNMTFGKRDVLTIIGPATIVREIRKNPSKVDLLLQNKRRR